MRSLLILNSWFPYAISVGLHTALLLGAGLSFCHEAQYSVQQQSNGGMQVDWVSVKSDASAAADSDSSRKEPVNTMEERIPEIPLSEESLATTATNTSQVATSSSLYPTHTISAPPTSTHTMPSPSSPRFHSSTDMRSDKGTIVRAQPNYLKNPPPVYPEQARERKQEGLVILSVLVGIDGNPVEVVLENSSGYTLLDQAATRAVNRWKFKPATIGNSNVLSQVDVPIRFQLK